MEQLSILLRVHFHDCFGHVFDLREGIHRARWGRRFELDESFIADVVKRLEDLQPLNVTVERSVMVYSVAEVVKVDVAGEGIPLLDGHGASIVASAQRVYSVQLKKDS